MATSNPVRLDARLSACAGYLRPGVPVADVGCDHGKLTAYLALQGFAVVQTICRHLRERALRRSGRYAALEEDVRDLAHRSAGRVRSEARTSYRLRAEHADIRAAEQVDIDGRHIKVG